MVRPPVAPPPSPLSPFGIGALFISGALLGVACGATRSAATTPEPMANHGDDPHPTTRLEPNEPSPQNATRLVNANATCAEDHGREVCISTGRFPFQARLWIDNAEMGPLAYDPAFEGWHLSRQEDDRCHLFGTFRDLNQLARAIMASGAQHRCAIPAS